MRELIAADARLRVADVFLGQLSDSPYFTNYERWTVEWRMVLGEVDGESALIRLQLEAGEWAPRSIVRLNVADNRITSIVDYGHCPWVLPAATSVVLSQSAPN